MTQSIEDMLNEWHSSVGDGAGSAVPGFETRNLRKDLITEEYREVIKAIDSESRAQVAKELADLVYVVYGTARAYDIPLDKVVAEVHHSNMTKLIGGIKRRDDGKILKGVWYEEANVEKILKEANVEKILNREFIL